MWNVVACYVSSCHIVSPWYDTMQWYIILSRNFITAYQSGEHALTRREKDTKDSIKRGNTILENNRDNIFSYKISFFKQVTFIPTSSFFDHYYYYFLNTSTKREREREQYKWNKMNRETFFIEETFQPLET